MTSHLHDDTEGVTTLGRFSVQCLIADIYNRDAGQNRNRNIKPARIFKTLFKVFHFTIFHHLSLFQLYLLLYSSFNKNYLVRCFIHKHSPLMFVRIARSGIIVSNSSMHQINSNFYFLGEY